MSCEFLTKIGTGDCELEKKCKTEHGFSNVLATELVSEMVDNAIDIAGGTNKDNFTIIVDGILDNLSERFHDMAISDGKNEMDSCALPRRGLGDQLRTKEAFPKEETTVRYPPVEKKNRITDLVKNSRHILEKFIISDKGKEASSGKPEKLVRVVELDTSSSCPEADPELRLTTDIPSPRDESFEIDEGQMEDVEIHEEDEDDDEDENIQKSKTLPMASTSSEKTLSLTAKWRTLKMSSNIRKKKWNLGSKIVNYIRKHHGKSMPAPTKEDSDGYEDVPIERR